MNLNQVIYELSNYQDEITMILLFLMIFILVFVTLKKINLFEENKAIPGILALVVSLISVWYLTEKQIVSILMSYNILGLLITFLLPFAIIFVFLHKTKTTSTLRKSIWVIFGIIFLYRYYTQELELNNFIFWISITIILGAIFLDESIHKNLQ